MLDTDNLVEPQALPVDVTDPHTASGPDTYPRPPHGWTCFHCGETFRDYAKARIHFGEKPSMPVGCSVDLVEYRRMRRALHNATVKLIKLGHPLTRDESDFA